MSGHEPVGKLDFAVSLMHRIACYGPTKMAVFGGFGLDLITRLPLGEKGALRPVGDTVTFYHGTCAQRPRAPNGLAVLGRPFQARKSRASVIVNDNVTA